MADVVLTAALRSNLQALQLTQSLIDKTQLNLSTGKKVNSALDSPQNYFAALSLSNRASDLTSRLDGIGQSIQTVKAADVATTSLGKLVDQATSIANTARDKVASGSVLAGFTGTKSLKGIDDLTTSTSGIQTGDQIVLSVTDDNNDQISLNSTTGAAANTYTITFRPSTTALAEGEVTSTQDLVNTINGIRRNSDGSQVFDATLDSNGQLQVTARSGYSFRAVFSDSAGAGANTANDRAIAESLGLGNYVRFDESGGGAATTNRVALTASNKSVLSSLKFNDSTTSKVATRSSTLANLIDDTSTARFTGADAGDNLSFEVVLKNGTRKQVSDLLGTTGISASTIGGVVDAINGNTTLNPYVKAGFNETTGQFTLEAVSADVQGMIIGATDSNSNNNAVANFGFGAFANTGTTQFSINPGQNAALYSKTENIVFAQGSAQLADLKNQYQGLMDQIDKLVDDSKYAGTNLLNGDSLTTYFNEDRTSSLVTGGKSLKYTGLGLSKNIDFSSVATTDSIVSATKAAQDVVRGFSSSLANDLSIIQTREDFTKSLVSTLKEGSDKLTLADQNEESAKLLSLQTRQSLGVTALSLASQSQQAVLRLF